jgi:hypothetical protein
MSHRGKFNFEPGFRRGAHKYNFAGYVEYVHIMILQATLLLVWVGGVFGAVNLSPPPVCYAHCLAQTLNSFGCKFADVSRRGWEGR